MGTLVPQPGIQSPLTATDAASLESNRKITVLSGIISGDLKPGCIRTGRAGALSAAFFVVSWDLRVTPIKHRINKVNMRFGFIFKTFFIISPPYLNLFKDNDFCSVYFIFLKRFIE
jgi:hypothetical protein